MFEKVVLRASFYVLCLANFFLFFISRFTWGGGCDLFCQTFQMVTLLAFPFAMVILFIANFLKEPDAREPNRILSRLSLFILLIPVSIFTLLIPSFFLAALICGFIYYLIVSAFVSEGTTLTPRKIFLHFVGIGVILVIACSILMVLMAI